MKPDSAYYHNALLPLKNLLYLTPKKTPSVIIIKKITRNISYIFPKHFLHPRTDTEQV